MTKKGISQIRRQKVATTHKQTHSEEQEQSQEIDAFLIEDYKHASQYSQNTQKDRTVTSNLYIVMLGALSYAFVLIHTGRADIDTNLFTIGLLLFYSLVNFICFAHFVTLGVNCRDSISRMDEIRQYYINLSKSYAIKRIYAVDREFVSPRRLRPTNAAICGAYTTLELMSFVATGVLLNTYLHLPIVLLTIILSVAVILVACLQVWYYKTGLVI
jgi:hypothetical protein